MQETASISERSANYSQGTALTGATCWFNLASQVTRATLRGINLRLGLLYITVHTFICRSFRLVPTWDFTPRLNELLRHRSWCHSTALAHWAGVHPCVVVIKHTHTERFCRALFILVHYSAWIFTPFFPFSFLLVSTLMTEFRTEEDATGRIIDRSFYRSH